jgi:UDP-N-acetyl-D-mannosaminuronic acid transferase (WecB/TagA/CpsF family)
MQHICTVAPERGYRIFVLAASDDVSATAVTELQHRFAKINIVGRTDGYWKDDGGSLVCT